MANDIHRLGQYVEQRRKELQLSQIEVWQAGGPSNSTLTGLETGSAATVGASTLRKLDRALRWHTGSAQAVLDGGEPRDALQSDESGEHVRSALSEADRTYFGQILTGIFNRPTRGRSASQVLESVEYAELIDRIEALPFALRRRVRLYVDELGREWAPNWDELFIDDDNNDAFTQADQGDSIVDLIGRQNETIDDADRDTKARAASRRMKETGDSTPGQ